MTNIEWEIAHRLSDLNDGLAKGRRVTHLIENVRIAIREIGDDEIGCAIRSATSTMMVPDVNRSSALSHTYP